MKRNSFAALLAAVLIVGVAAQAHASGAGAIALTFPVGARYNSMGEAGTALSQDASAIWWNPGGLAFMPQRQESREAQVMQSKLVPDLANDIQIIWAGYGMPLGANGALGFGLTYLDMGTQIATDENGNEIGTFDSWEFAFAATYGVRLSRTLGAGIGIKYYRDKLAPDNVLQDSGGSGSGDSFGVDLGVLWKVPAIRSNLALAIANLGPDIAHVDQDQSDPMPRKLTLGWAFSVYSSQAMGLLLVADYQMPLYKWKGNDYGFGIESSDQHVYGGGGEWNYMRSLFLRMGYKYDKTGNIKDITWGFGVDLNEWTGQAFYFDFASVPQAEGLDTVKRFSLGYRF